MEALTRTQLIQWLNGRMNSEVARVEDLASGVVACRLVDSVCPNILFMHRLRIDSATEYDFITNYKVLQDALTYLQVDKNIDVGKLGQGRASACLDMLQFLYQFYHEVTSGRRKLPPPRVVSGRKHSSPSHRTEPQATRRTPGARAEDDPKTLVPKLHNLEAVDDMALSPQEGVLGSHISEPEGVTRGAVSARSRSAPRERRDLDPGLRLCTPPPHYGSSAKHSARLIEPGTVLYQAGERLKVHAQSPSSHNVAVPSASVASLKSMLLHSPDQHRHSRSEADLPSASSRPRWAEDALIKGAAAVDMAVAALLRALPELEKMRLKMGVDGRDSAVLRARMSRRVEAMSGLQAEVRRLLPRLAALAHAPGPAHVRELAARLETQERELDALRRVFRDERDAIARAEIQHPQLPWQHPGPHGYREDHEGGASVGHAEVRQLTVATSAVARVLDLLELQGASNPAASASSRGLFASPHALANGAAGSQSSSPQPAPSAVPSALIPARARSLSPSASAGWKGVQGGGSPQSVGHIAADASPLSLRRMSPEGGGLASTSLAEQRPRRLAPDPPAKAAEGEGLEWRFVALANGDTFAGQYAHGRRSGLGVYVFHSQDRYEGQFMHGEVAGAGVYRFASGGRYEGQWERGAYHGYGVEQLARGSAYSGHFVEGLREGWGVCQYHNGDRYKGHWKKGLRHGMGRQRAGDGSSYVGHFHQGKRHGRGVFTFANGDRYCGEYMHDRVHGVGAYYFTNGQVYEGRWENGKKSGPLVYTVETGQCFAAEFSDRDLLWCERLEEVLARGGTVVGACSATDLNALREGARSAAQEATLQANNYWAADQPLQSLQRLTTRQVEAAQADAIANAKDSVTETSNLHEDSLPIACSC
eukprot:CAMPEP_0114318306 /NCGR_PEP_ID=MMETSP0059-20121206/24503_1 /TAXON_ID=36894 /ORGANISM="Pyramimonas parkeae, Strain CCMP726" /LENGTH=877 /DNA_ID=CAMNT_0001444969 /DNA_START=17 /DNA_END=2650 /DNA_ORIENTATION=-